MATFNIFSDPVLKARQDQLDAQWNSLWSNWQLCNQTPTSLFSEFTTDLKNWKTFYDSGSDWSSDSNNATNRWQDSANKWENNLRLWGCTGNPDDAYDRPNGIPTVPVTPADESTWLQGAEQYVSDTATGITGGIMGTLKTVGWVTVGMIVLLIVGVMYVLAKANVELPGIGKVSHG